MKSTLIKALFLATPSLLPAAPFITSGGIRTRLVRICLLPWKVHLVTVRDSPVPGRMDVWEGGGLRDGLQTGLPCQPLPTSGQSLRGHDGVC